MMDDTDREKIARLYGLLWNVKTDRSTFSGAAVSEARKIALSMINKDGQARGIAWANEKIPEIVSSVRMEN